MEIERGKNLNRSGGMAKVRHLSRSCTNCKYNQLINMSIDKTLRLTEESGSEVVSILDMKLRASIGYCSNGLEQQLPKMTNSYSLKKLKTEPNSISQLEYENQLLRLEICNLRRQFKLEKEGKIKELQQLEQEVLRLRKLIEKSYYSLKVLQNENTGLRMEQEKSREGQKKVEERNSFLEQKLGEMCSYIQNAKSCHEKEMKLVWERVAHLQRNLESVVHLIEEDKRQDKLVKSQVRAVRVESIGNKSFRFN